MEEIQKESPLRVVSLSVDNFLRIKTAEIRPKGNVVEISGPNAAGKSSLIGAIFCALGGKGEEPSDPIRRGAQSARIKCDLGELIVTKKFMPGGGASLVVESAASGVRVASPQKVLDALYGELTFDPMEFAQAKPADQLEMLGALMGDLSATISKLDADNAGDYEQRTATNRQVKSLQAQVDAVIIPDGLRAERIDIGAVTGDMEAAANANAAIEKQASSRRAMAMVAKNNRERAVSRREDIDQLKARIKILEDEAASLCADAEKTEAEIASAPELPPVVDLSTFRETIARAKETNDAIDVRDKKRVLREQLDEYQQLSAELSKRIEHRTERKREAIASAKFPVPGLAFGDGQVLYSGVPFAQASSAEQIMVSLAIAKAMNPRLRILHIRNGSLLDSKMMAAIREELGGADGWQLWIEKVSETGKVGVVLEDGEVIAVNEEKVNAAS